VAEDVKIMVATAMSLRNVLPPLIDAFRKQSPAAEVVASYGASGDLRRQVEGGAPIDAVIFAAASDVDMLVERGEIAGGKRVIASNSLVLIGPRGAEPLTFETIDRVPAGEYIAIGDPKTVPAGRYAQEVLQALNKWDAVQNRLVLGGHVAAVLQYARRGEVAAAVVYGTDIKDVDDVVVLDHAGGQWAPRIETVAAVVAGGKEATARAFVDFLETPAARAIFTAHGFGAPGGAAAGAAP
jgi:molybdate transport system substrate-binding protein